jgi:hypothetical protein
MPHSLFDIVGMLMMVPVLLYTPCHDKLRIISALYSHYGTVSVCVIKTTNALTVEGLLPQTEYFITPNIRPGFIAIRLGRSEQFTWNELSVDQLLKNCSLLAVWLYNSALSITHEKCAGNETLYSFVVDG